MLLYATIAIASGLAWLGAMIVAWSRLQRAGAPVWADLVALGVALCGWVLTFEHFVRPLR